MKLTNRKPTGKCGARVYVGTCKVRLPALSVLFEVGVPIKFMTGGSTQLAEELPNTIGRPQVMGFYTLTMGFFSFLLVIFIVRFGAPILESSD